MRVTRQVTKTVTETVVDDILCNRCGKSCKTDCGNYEGLIEVVVEGGYGSRVVGDLTAWRFSACEVCLGEYAETFKIPVTVSSQFDGDAAPEPARVAFLRADIAAIDALLDDLPPTRVIERMGFESRRAEHLRELAESEGVVATYDDANDVLYLKRAGCVITETYPGSDVDLLINHDILGLACGLQLIGARAASASAWRHHAAVSCVPADLRTALAAWFALDAAVRSVAPEPADPESSV
jgi:hypothetical protein